MQKIAWIPLLLSLCFEVFALGIPKEIDLGIIDDQHIVTRALIFENPSPNNLKLNFLSGCDCVALNPDFLNISPGSAGMVEVAFDPRDYLGEVKKFILIKSSDSELDRKVIYVVAKVTAGGEGTIEKVECLPCERKQRWIDEIIMNELVNTWVIIDYYFSPGCRECEVFLKGELPRLEGRMRSDVVHAVITVNRYDILELEVFEELVTAATAIGVEIEAFPVLILGNVVLQGSKEIKAKIEGAVEQHIALRQPQASGSAADAESSPGEAATASTGDRMKNLLSPLPVFVAGLIDGVNPCAFSTLLFMLSMLALLGHSKGEILVIGGSFALSVFVTYLAIGFGFLNIMRSAAPFPIIATAMEYLLLGVLLLFAGLSLYDVYLIKKGRASQMILQLPGAVKKRIHKTIREKMRTPSIIGGTLATGVVVTFFELVCTGQIYLPTITYMVRIRAGSYAVMLLLLYNISFILPLLVLFALIYAGIASPRIVSFFKQSLLKIKLAMAFTFILLAALILL